MAAPYASSRAGPIRDQHGPALIGVGGGDAVSSLSLRPVPLVVPVLTTCLAFLEFCAVFVLVLGADQVVTESFGQVLHIPGRECGVSTFVERGESGFDRFELCRGKRAWSLFGRPEYLSGNSL
ncbi:hypothetical protein [Nocardia xishanensis]